ASCAAGPARTPRVCGRSRGYAERGPPPADLFWHVVGVTGFEPAASSARTKRATKLRHTPLLQPFESTCGSLRTTHRRHVERAVRVSGVASGRQANRTGAEMEGPHPALTSTGTVRPPWVQVLSPLACFSGMSQF